MSAVKERDMILCADSVRPEGCAVHPMLGLRTFPQGWGNKNWEGELAGSAESSNIGALIRR